MCSLCVTPFSILFNVFALLLHLHISHNAPYLPPVFCITLCFSFLLGITAVPRETVNKACLSKIWEGGGGGANKVHCGRCASSVYFLCYISHFPFLFSHFDTSHIICIPNPLYSLASSQQPLCTHLI